MTLLSKNNVASDKLATVMNAHHKKFMAIGLSLIGMGLIHQASLLPQNQSNHVMTWNAEDPALDTAPVLNPVKPHNMVFHNYFHSKLDAFVHVLGVSEGKAHFFYLDNKGIAIAYGWNPTRNSKEFNLMVAQAMKLNAHQQKLIEDISDNPQVQYVPKGLKGLVLTDAQIKTAANIFLTTYESEFLKVLKIKATQHNEDFSALESNYHKLPYNQQAVLIHMTYKLGLNRLQNYHDFFNNLVPYMKNPSEKGLYKVADDFEYNYQTRKGDWKHDNRTEQTHQIFFSQCSDDSNKITVSQNFYNCKDYIRKNTVVLNPGQSVLSVKVHDVAKKVDKTHTAHPANTRPVMLNASNTNNSNTNTKGHHYQPKGVSTKVQMANIEKTEKRINEIRHGAQIKVAARDNKNKKQLSS